MLQAVRAVDELGGWITSCQMLKSCQLTVCEEEGGQLLTPRKKRGSLKSNYRLCHVDEGKPSVCCMDLTQMHSICDTQKFLIFFVNMHGNKLRQSEEVFVLVSMISTSNGFNTR